MIGVKIETLHKAKTKIRVFGYVQIPIPFTRTYINPYISAKFGSPLEIPSKILAKAVEEIAQLPGIGKRTALRLALHMLQRPALQTEVLARSLEQLVNDLQKCTNCYNLSDEPLCSICKNPLRDEKVICVVEDIRDVMAIESTGQYRGVYHVLGGKISPLQGIGPEQLNLDKLLLRLNEVQPEEIIFALSSTLEGDTTIFYIYQKIKAHNLRLSTIARGVALGEELEYTDQNTLAQSIQHRVPYEETLSRG